MYINSDSDSDIISVANIAQFYVLIDPWMLDSKPNQPHSPSPFQAWLGFSELEHVLNSGESQLRHISRLAAR